MTHSYQTFTIREIKEKVITGKWDLNPDWQRGSVWKTEQKQSLIDSLDKEIPVPHITIWTRPHGNAVMVDGKQRTETVVGFVGDDFCAEENDWFSGRREANQEAFLDKQIQVLVFRSCVDEDDIVEYFERINSGSKQLSNGELINSLCRKPIVSNTEGMFFTENDFQIKWTRVFGQPREDAKRMKCHEDTVPYLTSSMFGVNFLTKSYPVIATVLKTTDQTDVNDHWPDFMYRMNVFMEVCRRIFEECPQMRPAWSKQGLPPLRQVSAIWLSILDTQYIDDPVTFWPDFYRLLSTRPDIKALWDLQVRKNGKPTQLVKEIQFAISYDI